MAKDDYHVVVYQILSNLYVCLKKGEQLDESLLTGERLFGIKEDYRKYILYNLLKDGYITGFEAEQSTYIDGTAYIKIGSLKNCQITPKGIEYLSDNSFMKKAMEFFKDVKNIIPFV